MNTKIPKRKVKRWKAYFVWVNDGEWREMGPVWAFGQHDAVERAMLAGNHYDEKTGEPRQPHLKWKVVRMGAISDNFVSIFASLNQPKEKR